jgi:hypothetical protein
MAYDRKMKTDPSIVYQYYPNGNERCDKCAMFRPHAGCSAVLGVIDKKGWCRIFESMNTLRIKK